MTVALLGEQASAELVKGTLDIAREMARAEVEKQLRKPLRQQELLKEYRFDIRYLKYLKAHGLKSRRQGKSVYYDVRDVDAILEKLKE
ncbi:MULTISPECIES: hypothetical protein [Streptococcus]|uniref:hypothetical protein n=1 Tax=Streptococcus TaxID=1301 RepID=UPI001386D8B3|nr:hypothetical protein [Streptococcus sp. S784/96/1]